MLDEPSKEFLLTKMRCTYCEAEGVELTTLVMHHSDYRRNCERTTTTHYLICVPCNRLIRTSLSPKLREQFPKEAEALVRRGICSGYYVEGLSYI